MAAKDVPPEREVIQELQQVPIKPQTLEAADFNQYANTPGEKSKVADFQAKRPIAIRDDVPFDLHIVAHEEFTTNGTAGDTETFNLGYNALNAASHPTPFLLYEGGSQVQPDAVNYSGDSFDYTDDGTSNTLHAFYVVADQAQLTIQKVAPNDTTEQLTQKDAGLINRKDQLKDPEQFGFGHALEGVIPTNWKLEVWIDAPYQITWQDGTHTGATADNLLLSIPIRRAADKVQGLAHYVAQRAAVR